MNFPAANVSVKDWDKDEDYLVYILLDQFIYTAKNEYYEKFLRGNLFVDSKGDIYKVTGRRLPSAIRKIFSFIPNFYKVELIFQRTNDRMTIEQVRQHMLNQVKKIDDDNNKIEWLDKIKNGETYDEILFG